MIGSAESVEQIFVDAMSRAPWHRAAFLDIACKGLPAIRRAVEDRLSAITNGTEPTLDYSLPGSGGVRSPFLGDAPTPEKRFRDGQVIAGRFKVVRFIDRGGMGEVYEVEDRFLQDVHVALKVILPEIAEDPGSSHRFEQEVLLARKVTHPNLCPIYDIARSSDPPPAFLFLTMKLLVGETLSARLRRSEPLTREQKVSIFQQMLAGIGAIHAGGIIHRDIKPNNVMLDESGPELCLSIMDFGLARHHEPDTTMTAHSMVAGTPGYIAPEMHTQGPSHASDLYALGVLLHQVATGEHPRFDLETRSIEPDPVLDKADVPPILTRAVKDFLSSDPQRRVKTFKQISAELNAAGRPHPLNNKVKTLAGTIALLVLIVGLLLVPAIGERLRGILFASAEKHIVVLPFNLTGADSETRALADGLMDSLAGRLSNLDPANQSLWVVPAGEVRGRNVTNPAAARREFGATLVVEGRFERVNQVPHLKLTLVDPNKLRDIGYMDVEEPSGDIGALQDQAVTRLARLMNISDKDEAANKLQKPQSPQAYEEYLLALGYSQRFDLPGNLDRAAAALQSAIKDDPHFTLAFARLGEVYVLKYRTEKNPAWLPIAKRYSEQALQMDSRVPLAHVALAQVLQYTGHNDLAAQEFQRASDLDPRDPDALTGLAKVERDLGHFPQAEAIYIKAANLRPTDWYGYNTLGQFYDRTGRPRDAIAQFRHAIELAPDNAPLYANLGAAYSNLRDPKAMPDAEQALNKSISLHPTYWAYTNLGMVYNAENRLADAVDAYKKALNLNDKDYEVWNNLAEMYVWLGDQKSLAETQTSERLLLEQAVRVNPQDAEAQSTLAVVLARHNREDAEHRIAIALALQPDDRSVLSNIAEAYMLMDDRKLALTYLQRALKAGMSEADLRTDPYLHDLAADPGIRQLKASGGT